MGPVYQVLSMFSIADTCKIFTRIIANLVSIGDTLGVFPVCCFER